MLHTGYLDSKDSMNPRSEAEQKALNARIDKLKNNDPLNLATGIYIRSGQREIQTKLTNVKELTKNDPVIKALIKAFYESLKINNFPIVFPFEVIIYGNKEVKLEVYETDLEEEDIK